MLTKNFQKTIHKNYNLFLFTKNVRVSFVYINNNLKLYIIQLIYVIFQFCKTKACSRVWHTKYDLGVHLYRGAMVPWLE